MDQKIEEMIINNFFQKNTGSRLLYELKSAKKREHFFDKIAHRCEDFIDCGLIIQKSYKLIDIDTIKQILDSKNCYVIAYRSKFDGTFADLETVLNELWGNGPYLLYSADSDSLYLETEYDFEVHPSYILSKLR